MRKYSIGDLVYVNTPGGEAGTILAYVIYEECTDYLVLFKDRTIQYGESALSDEKVLEL